MLAWKYLFQNIKIFRKMGFELKVETEMELVDNILIHNTNYPLSPASNYKNDSKICLKIPKG